MQVVPWLLLLAAAVRGLAFLRAVDAPTTTGLCNEPEALHAGYINGLFYTFYETRAQIRAPSDVPVVLWLSGGPGCSGMIAMLFENGPCSVGEDSAGTATLNKYSWTNAAHMIYIDQPRGAGYSPAKNAHADWSESNAVDDLVTFLQGFFQNYPDYGSNDLYIFGESYAGHYVPDLAHAIVSSTDWNTRDLRGRLKGVGIGNGLVSERAIADTIGTFAKAHGTASDIVKSRIIECEDAVDACQSVEYGGIQDCSRTGLCDTLVGDVIADAHTQKRNHYDLRAACHPDTFQLCYKFTPLYTFLNSATTMHRLGTEGRPWAPCNQDIFAHHMNADWFEESEYKVAYLLDHGLRVLIYAGDQDLICNWMAQDKWTQDMQWSNQTQFQTQPMRPLLMQGQAVGEQRSFGGLTMLRVYDAGHMVPFDQPQVALAMFQAFVQRH
ncbi:serine carboxypeptidase-like 48-like [Achlya hypogyna]|uniref:Carboxypeptidase n=1 Tax=Achlya hypogyna TaxID=1202772 RepID=A0A0A7CMT6_ACHHY|nr:secreted protein [Achlya hypogyna]OQR87199.1 serine carboxypeptidase-like 48-like [Achlya hypogyna]